MATELWSQLRTRVFYKLDMPSNTSGDLANAVDQALQNALIEIANDVRLRELLAETSAVNLVNPAETLNIVTDFSVTDLQEILAVQVNTQPAVSGSEYKTWNELSYDSWVRGLAEVGGDLRPDYRWSLGPSDDIYFTSVPSSGVTWAVKIVYYKHPVAFAAGNTPEFPEEHYEVLVNGAAIEFPQYFSGEREPLFSRYAGAYVKGKERLLHDQTRRAALKRLKSRISINQSSRLVWADSIF